MGVLLFINVTGGNLFKDTVRVKAAARLALKRNSHLYILTGLKGGTLHN